MLGTCFTVVYHTFTTVYLKKSVTKRIPALEPQGEGHPKIMETSLEEQSRLKKKRAELKMKRNETFYIL